ncbi:MAG TPA: hypothetical protein VFV52_09915 [Bacilli bacterium]|nr:hypothetical protein [Bacilli bacterium]
MKKWLLAWLVFTGYLIANMTIMGTAEQPHLVATLLLGFFFSLIFGLRGVYGAMAAVSTIVLLAMIAHQLKHPSHGWDDISQSLFRLLLDLVTIMGGGGFAYWMKRMFRPEKRA